MIGAKNLIGSLPKCQTMFIKKFHSSNLRANIGIKTPRPLVVAQNTAKESLFASYVSSISKNVKSISAKEAHDLMHATRYGPHKSVHLIDVREPAEWNLERISSAEYYGRGLLERDIASKVPDTNDTLILYCASGMRSVLAADSLQRMGYQNVKSLDGGIGAWKTMGFEVEKGNQVYTPRFVRPESVL